MRSIDALSPARNPSKRGALETEFLPAALEIVETPASPSGRALGGVILLIFSVAVIWACIGRIDIVATAPGKIISSDGTKILQPFETSVIKAIHVVDGQKVKADDIVIELDTTVAEAERKHLSDDLLAAQLDTARLRASLADTNDVLSAFTPPGGVNPVLLAMERQLLLDQVAEQKAKLASLDRQRAQREAERLTTAATIEKLQTSIPFIEQRMDIRKSLSDKELGSKLLYLETIQQLNESRYELAVQKKRYEETNAAVEAVIEAKAQAIAEYRRGRATDLADAGRKVIGLREDLVKADQRLKMQTIRAPVDGIVQQLAVHTVGGIVTPAQALLSIVPMDSQLEVEARIANRDIGFVTVGQKTAIKIDTFNFTRYGFRHGTVISVSRDAIVRDKGPGKSSDTQLGSASSSSEPSGQELIYSARISLDKTTMMIDDNEVKLTPGMAATVEISTGSRTVMSYLLSPVARYLHDSLRER